MHGLAIRYLEGYMNQSPLLVDPQALALESLTSKDTQVILVVKTTKSVAPCPKCQQPSSRVHSRYERTVTDLPWQGVTVKIQLLTRRFFCINKTCVRRTFANGYLGLWRLTADKRCDSMMPCI